MAIHELDEQAISFTGAQVGIVTDSTHRKARIKEIRTERMRRALDAGKIVIVAGFQGIDEDFNITTLGRGGSDTTAVALAAVMKHSGQGVRSQESGVRSQESGPTPIPDSSQQTTDLVVDCEIYTDVDGVYTTDPRIVPEARKIDAISYDEMLELASAGAGVMHSRSIEFAKKFDVPIQVRSSFSDVEGTWIVPEAAWMQAQPGVRRRSGRATRRAWPSSACPTNRASAIASSRPWRQRNIVVDMIAQNVGSNGRAAIGFTVPIGEVPVTLAALQPLAREWGASVEQDREVSKVSIVGAGMRTHTGVAERMFAALAAEKINIKMITTADIKISVLVERADGVRALRRGPQGVWPCRSATGGGQGDACRDTAAAFLGHDLAALTHRLSNMEDILVTEVRLVVDQGRITLFGLPDAPGNCSRIFQAVASGGIVVDMIIQNMTAGRPELSFSVPQPDLARALELSRSAAQTIASETEVFAEAEIANVYVMGVGMRTHTGVARRMFGALAERGINISMINTSEVRISVVVDRARGEEAEECLREAFHLA